MQSFENLRGKALMDAYQFVEIGIITAPTPQSFSIELTLKEALQWERSIYIFLFNDEIIRVGSSKGKLGNRMKQWDRDVTNALHKMKGLSMKKSNTPEWEANNWYNLLSVYNSGKIYAREGATVRTPVGEFKAYMDEESILINRHKPRLNRHTNR